jgi:hypothetical protein
MLLAGQAAISTVTWLLDRQFYIDALDNEEVYDNLLSDEMLDTILRSQFALPAEADTQPVADVLREIISDDYLQDQISAVVNDFFDYLQGKTSEFNPTISLQPVKTALTEENQAEFMSALLQALPSCAPGELPSIGGENQNICKPQGISDEALMETYLVPAMPAIIAQLPDELPLGEEWQQWQMQERWRSFIPGMAVPASLMLSVLALAFVAVCLWYLTALIADAGWRGRLQWLGWSLLIPSVTIFALGFLVNSSSALYWLNYWMRNGHVTLYPSVLGTQAIIQAVSASILPRISSAFMMVGGVCGSLSLGLILWGLMTPRKTVE